MQRNATPPLTQRQAIALQEAIATDSVQGFRDLAMMKLFFLTGWQVSRAYGEPAPLPADQVDALYARYQNHYGQR